MSSLKAIDLYSGVGGWKLGLKMAGVDVISSYEYWQPAIDTQMKNFNVHLKPIDIRTLTLEEIDTSANVVVGSPPCTQFSISNRGGKGDIADGLLDIKKFLEVVEYVQPKYWVMENVPRVAGILEREISTGSLQQFKHLFGSIDVFNMEDFGLPQRRRRMLAGNYPRTLFSKYAENKPFPTLGQVLSNLDNRSTIIDPNYGFSLTRDKLTDQNYEIALNSEEERINRANKQYHPVYNIMNFPDSATMSSRTVTATCTRVSRESIIIKNAPVGFRRLTIRERATLQSFPITYQFYSNSYTNRVKMIGNAVPPLITYYLAAAMTHVPVLEANPKASVKYQHQLPAELPDKLRQPKNRLSFPETRKFCFAIPNLRFGSGVRFELTNKERHSFKIWRIRFIYGVPDDIRELKLGKVLLTKTLNEFGSEKIAKALLRTRKRILSHTGKALQLAWIHKSEELHPFDFMQIIGEEAALIRTLLLKDYELQEISEYTLNQLDLDSNPFRSNINSKRYVENSVWILAGFLIGSFYNSNRE
jgi:DNA (cytosine-5)-methyltransferase 1